MQCTRKDCKLWRDLPMKYLYNYEKGGWKVNFKCSKLKLKGFQCRKRYEFKQSMYQMAGPNPEKLREA